MVRILTATALVAATASFGASVDFVDPMIGTAGGGNTLPGPL